MIQPRLLRLRDAPHYLGMDKNRFNREVRPTLTAIPIGKQGIAFDRLDLDQWIDHYKACNGRPTVRRKRWDVKERQGFLNVEKSGISTNTLTEDAFAKALAQASLKKRSGI